MEAPICSDQGDADQLVRDVMITRPKTLPAEATVADLRRYFANPRVANALLVAGSRLVGVVDREQLADGLDDDAPATSLACRERVTIAAGATVAEAMARLDENGTSRLVVVGDDGATVEGLLCLNTRRTGFCT